MIRCLTHQSERTVPASFTACQIGLSVGKGVLLGYLSGHLISSSLKGASGGLIGTIAGVSDFVVGRIASNTNLWGSDQEQVGRGICRLIQLWTVSWFLPLAGRLVSSKVTNGAVFAYWVAAGTLQGSVRLFECACTGNLVGRQALRYGLLERLSRPRMGKVVAEIDDNTLRALPAMPNFLEPADPMMQQVPALVELCQQGGIDDDGVRIVRALEREAGRCGNVLEAEFHKAVRNLAYQIHMTDNACKKREYLEKVVSLSGGCPQRQVPETYLLIAEVAAGARGPVEQVRVRVRCEVQELKRQLFRDLQPQFNPETFWSRVVGHEDEAQDVVAFTRGAGQHLGFVQGKIDGQALLVARGHAGVEYENFFQSREALYGGMNEAFWVRAFKGRYTPDLLVSFFKNRVAGDENFRNLAQQVLFTHLDSLTAAEDVLDGVITPFYTEDVPYQRADGSLTTTRSLNNEGVILLLKLTGDFVDDNRLHTTMDNTTVLDGMVPS